jgi:HD-like signal output (HDOD) protein
MPAVINLASIQRAASNSVPFSFRLAALEPSVSPVIDAILQVFLSELGQETIQDPLSYCIKELISNAQKANTKRVYFEELGLDISRAEDYARGVATFHEKVSENRQHYVSLLRERRLLIDVSFHATRGALVIAVRNAVGIAKNELARIKERIARARTFHSFFEVLDTAVDTTEGAGLGIMMLIQFLKRIGLDERSFSIASKEGSTTASVVIPMSAVRLDQVRLLADVLVRDIENLPHFPENVVQLLQLTEDPDVTVADVSARVSRDPALTAEILRHVNSAYYGLSSRVNTVSSAVAMIGLKSLHSLLYSFGFRLVLDTQQARMRQLWEHSLRAATYSLVLARDLKRREDLLDDAYVAGMLHDIGVIAVTGLHPRTQQKMRRFSVERGLPVRILERFSFGMHHADIGALIAERWRFPEQLVEGIRYHHDPLLARGAFKDVVFCVYLANAVCDIERGFITFRQVDRSVLADFGIGDEAAFTALAARLKAGFEDSKER